MPEDGTWPPLRVGFSPRGCLCCPKSPWCAMQQPLTEASNAAEVAEKERSNDASRWEVVGMLQWGISPWKCFPSTVLGRSEGKVSCYEFHSGSGRAWGQAWAEEVSTSPWLWEQRKARNKSLLGKGTEKVLGRE